MPELPEVETTMRGILPHIQQQTIREVIIRQHQLRWKIPKNIASILQQQKIISAERRGKYLLLNLNKGTILIHLGMSGHLRILPEKTPHKKHDHVEIIFKNKKVLRLNDPRRFGAFLWIEEDPAKHPLLKNLGVEPLTPNFSGKYLYQKAQKSQMPIKAFLMENKIVTGVGNIYATEALFNSGIHPALSAKLISTEKLNVLVKEVKKILRQAIKRGGTTLKDFMKSDGKPGYFSNQLKVYGRAGLPCVECNNILSLMNIRQRSTVFCESCQKL